MSLTGSCPQLDLIYSADPKPFDRLLAQSLDLFESCTTLVETDEAANIIETSSKSISCELLSLLSAPLVSHKAKSLLWTLLQPQPSPTVALTLYNAYKDDALVTLLAASFKPIRLGHLYDIENLQKCLLVCKSLVQQQRAHNLVKFLTDKFESTDSFVINLNGLFWCVVNKCSQANGQLSAIGCATVSNLAPLIEALIETMHSFLLVDSANNRVIVDAYLRLLCSDSLEINFCARKTLLALLKQPKKSGSSGTATTTVGPSGPTTNATTTSKSAGKQAKSSSTQPTGGEPTGAVDEGLRCELGELWVIGFNWN